MESSGITEFHSPAASGWSRVRQAHASRAALDTAHHSLSQFEHTRRHRMAFQDILYDKKDGVAWITINRPEVRNAFRVRTVDEMVAAFRDAWADGDVGVVVLTGAGDKAFCSGGDQKERG